MKSFLPLLSLTLVFAGCSTAYKTGQTPDDVYFSPERPQAEYVRVEDKEDDKYYRGEQNRNSSDYYNYEEERYLRMKVRNRQRWTYLDNDFYSYNPYVYGNYNYHYSSPWNAYSYWDQCYNPYSRQIIVINPQSPMTNRPRTANLRVFDNPQNTTNNNPRIYNNKTRGYSSGNTNSSPTPRRNSNAGSELRNIFSNSGSSSGSSSSSSESGSSSSRTSTSPSSSSSSSSSGSSSGSSSSGSSSRGNATRGR